MSLESRVSKLEQAELLAFCRQVGYRQPTEAIIEVYEAFKQARQQCPPNDVRCIARKVGEVLDLDPVEILHEAERLVVPQGRQAKR